MNAFLVDHYLYLVRFSIAITLLAPLGCSDNSKPPAVDVSGEVLLNGEPFTGAAVRFYNADYGGGAFNLDEEGKFVSGSPLTVGEYLISLDRPGANFGEKPGDMKFPEDKTGEVPSKYRFARESGFIAQLAVEGDNHFVFNMTGKAKSNKPSATPEMIMPVDSP